PGQAGQRKELLDAFGDDDGKLDIGEPFGRSARQKVEQVTAAGWTDVFAVFLGRAVGTGNQLRRVAAQSVFPRIILAGEDVRIDDAGVIVAVVLAEHFCSLDARHAPRLSLVQVFAIDPRL